MKVAVRELKPENGVLIIGSDGLWDVIDGPVAVSRVSVPLGDAGHAPRCIAEELVDLAEQRWRILRRRADNISVVVIYTQFAETACRCHEPLSRPKSVVSCESTETVVQRTRTLSTSSSLSDDDTDSESSGEPVTAAVTDVVTDATKAAAAFPTAPATKLTASIGATIVHSTTPGLAAVESGPECKVVAAAVKGDKNIPQRVLRNKDSENGIDANVEGAKPTAAQSVLQKRKMTVPPSSTSKLSELAEPIAKRLRSASKPKGPGRFQRVDQGRGGDVG